MECTSCGRINRSGARFCGGSLAARCRACGSDNEADAKFCDACGASARGTAGRPGVELAGLEMPPTIHALLAARIERLRPEERTVLERVMVGRAGEPDAGRLEIEFVLLTEIDADGKLVASITFDCEDASAAFAEARDRQRQSSMT